MSHASTYQPKTAFTRWLDSRLPIIRFAADFMAFGTPRTLNYLWAFGAILRRRPHIPRFCPLSPGRGTVPSRSPPV